MIDKDKLKQYVRPISNDKNHGRYGYNIDVSKEHMLGNIDDFYTYTYVHAQFGQITKYLYYIEKTGDIMDCLMWDGPGIEDSYGDSEAMDFFTATWKKEITAGRIIPLNDTEKAKMLLLREDK
jgi:hypothetical protein